MAGKYLCLVYMTVEEVLFQRHSLAHIFRNVHVVMIVMR